VKLKYVLVLLMSCVAGPLCRADASNGESPVTIAALPFAEASADGRYAPLAEVVGDILMTRLSDAEGLAFVERAAIDEVLGELELSTTADAPAQARLGKAIGAQFVLTGSLTSSGDSIQLAAHLLEVSTTRVARSAKVTARGDELVNHVDKLARELIGQFNVKLPELTQEQIDQSPEASLHFMRALGYYYAGMSEHATTQFLKTLAINPDHAEARFYNGMNYFERVKEYGHARIEFARFLKKFGDHRLARRAKEKLQQCETGLGNPTEGGQR
jgi:TolB-like protein